MEKIAIFAIMATIVTIVMANSKNSMALMGYPVKEHEQLAQFINLFIKSIALQAGKAAH